MPRTFRRLAGAALLLLVMLSIAPLAAGATTTTTNPNAHPASAGQKTTTKKTLTPDQQAKAQLTTPKAIVLGIIEGLTEYLPVSSTGHLTVANRAMKIGQTSATKDVADTYTVVIQAGAILAVLVLFRKRFESMIQGVRGKSEEGRQLVYVLAAAFVPAAIVGIALESPIKKHLFGPWPVVEAWFVGGVVILAISRWFRQRRVGGGRGLSAMTVRDGVIVGVVQVLALWPGTSRSLVTILAALFLGCSLVAAVEFSFLLGFFTLTAATGYDLLRHGHAMFSAYGVANPLIGLVVAFLAAMVAIKWMITYLERHQLDIFGYYRIAIAAVVALLLVTNAI